MNRIFKCWMTIFALSGVACVSSTGNLATGFAWRELQETPGCANLNSKAVNRISLLDHPEVGASSLVPLFSAALRCLRKNDELGIDRIGHPLGIFADGSAAGPNIRNRRQLSAHLPVKDGLLRVALLARLEAYPGPDDLPKLAGQLGVQETQLETALALCRLDRQTPPLIFVKGVVERQSSRVFSRIRPFVPELMNGIVLPDKAPRPAWASEKSLRLKDWKIPGAVLIDVRSREEFAAGHEEGAVNLPYGLTGAPKWWEIADFLPHAGEEFDLGRLPSDKTAQIAFIGQSLQDPRPVKAQARARLAGWAQAAFVYGGERARQGLAYEQPTGTSEDCALADAEVARLVEGDSSDFVDVRSRAEFLQATVPGALHLNEVTVREGSVSFDAANEWRDEMAARFSAHQRRPSDANRKVIFFANDAMDPRGLAAAREARKAGVQAACWWRGGLAAWLNVKGGARPSTVVDQLDYSALLQAHRSDLWSSSCQESLTLRTALRPRVLAGQGSETEKVEVATASETESWARVIRQAIDAAAGETSTIPLKPLRFDGVSYAGLEIGAASRPSCLKRFKAFIEVETGKLERIPAELVRMSRELAVRGFQGDFKIPLKVSLARRQFQSIIFHACDARLISIAERVSAGIFGADLSALGRGLDFRLKGGRSPSWNEYLCEGRAGDLTVAERRFVRYFW